MAGLLFVAAFSWPCESHEWTIDPIVEIVCNELGLHRQLASSGITQFGVI